MNATERYRAAAHAMQSGVAMEIECSAPVSKTFSARAEVATGSCSPKHLRVGVNAAMADHAALALLLMNKGVFTRAEYEEALATSMEAEKARYEEHLSTKLGKNVVLA